MFFGTHARQPPTPGFGAQLRASCADGAPRRGRPRRLVRARRSHHGHRHPRRAVERRRAPQAEAAIAAVMAEMHRIDRAMSPHKADSELSRINRDAASAPVRAERRDVPPGRARAATSRGSPAAPSTSATPRSASSTTTARGIRPSDAALARARRAVGWQHLHARPRRAQPALRAPRHAHRPRRLRQGPCGGQRRRDPGAPRHPPRHRVAPAATAASSATGAAGPGRSRSATRAAPARWWRCCRWRTCRSRPPATTSATSSTTACAAIT